MTRTQKAGEWVGGCSACSPTASRNQLRRLRGFGSGSQESSRLAQNKESVGASIPQMKMSQEARKVASERIDVR